MANCPKVRNSNTSGRTIFRISKRFAAEEQLATLQSDEIAFASPPPKLRRSGYKRSSTTQEEATKFARRPQFFTSPLESIVQHRFRVSSILSVALAAAIFCVAPQAQADDELLTIGSKAPSLDVEHWVSDGNGKFKPVKEFEKGKVYVVEFWATWCGPCISSMPHLAETQKSYAKRGVQLISVSDEDLDTVTKFLERPYESAEEKGPSTYGELTSAYCLTTDPDRGTYEDYMRAAQQNGIPTCFIVGKDGKIDWIGHPMEMDKPLEAVVTDKWDREAFKTEMKAKQEAQKAMQEIFALLNKGDMDEALKKIDAVLEKTNDVQLGMIKVQVLVQQQKTEEAQKQLASVFEGIEEPVMTNQIAWSIYQATVGGQIKGNELMKTALAASKKAVATYKKPNAEKAALIDTVARIQHELGNTEEAIKLMKEAIEHADARSKKDMKEFLKEISDEE